MQEQDLLQFNQLSKEVLDKYSSLLDEHEKESLLSILDKLPLIDKPNEKPVTLDYVFEKNAEQFNMFGFSDLSSIKAPSKTEFDEIMTSMYDHPLFKNGMTNITTAIKNNENIFEAVTKTINEIANQSKQS
jgi:hypothetical protein